MQRQPLDGSPSIDRRRFLGMLGAAAAGATVAPLAHAAGEAPPNIVVIFTDDQGYQDLGCFGSPLIRTPRIDTMAAEGMRFTDFYVAAPVCTPSRAALMTGCYPKRVGLHRGVLFPQAKRGLNPSEVTVAEILKTRGYATTCIGKWHLGDHESFLPMRQGFDSYFGIPYSNDMGRHVKPKRGVPLMRNDTVIEHPAEQTTLTERYTSEAVSFIKANRTQPFFLYLAHTFPHVPLYVSKKFAGRSERGLYGDVIECIDWSTGVILDTLRQLRLDRRTIVIFTSDNGPWLVKKDHAGSALPLRGGKQTTWEGGLREPCVMWGPGRIPAGRTCTEVASTLDLLPTAAALAGASVPTDRTIDGHDIRPLMFGTPGAKSPHERFFYYSSRGNIEAVREGPWKLRIANGGRGKKAGPVQLFNLREDISETTDRARENPQLVSRLSDALRAFDADLDRTARPVGRVS